MKHLSRDEMKKVMGGYVDKPCSKCCSDTAGTNCGGSCATGVSCNAGFFLVACPQNPDGTCATP